MKKKVLQVEDQYFMIIISEATKKLYLLFPITMRFHNRSSIFSSKPKKKD